MKRLGLVTIGQAPRVDLTPDLEPLLPGIEIIERGALDHLSNEEIAALVIADGDEVLVSRLRDGSSAVFGRDLHTVGLICPLPEQVDFIVQSMKSVCTQVIGEAASPYTQGLDAAVAAANRLVDRGAQLLVGFCMGYTEEMRGAVQRATGLPVVLVRSVSARLAAEVLQPVD